MTAPAGSVRARSGSISKRHATSADGVAASNSAAAASSSGPKREDCTTRRSERALPPTANATRGSGGSSSSRYRSASTRVACRASRPGGSEEMHRLVSRIEPMSIERIHVGPSRRVPTAICADPPPTSTTATRRPAGTRVPASAPAKPSRASSTADSSLTGTPALRSMRSRSSRPFVAWRPGLVTSTSTSSAP